MSLGSGVNRVPKGHSQSIGAEIRQWNSEATVLITELPHPQRKKRLQKSERSKEKRNGLTLQLTQKGHTG